MNEENPNEVETPAEDVAEGAIPDNFPYTVPTKINIGLGIGE